MLTAVEGVEARARGGIEGAVRWLTKPFELDELRSAVRAALDEPELAQRRRAQTQALRSIAQLERGGAPLVGASGRRPRLAGLEHRPARSAAPSSLRTQLGLLTDTQRRVVEAVRRTPTVRMAAAELGISRSSVYASLRRAARRLGIRSAPQLVARLRRPEG
jgi:FixJ family two-component response regulator